MHILIENVSHQISCPSGTQRRFSALGQRSIAAFRTGRAHLSSGKGSLLLVQPLQVGAVDESKVLVVQDLDERVGTL